MEHDPSDALQKKFGHLDENLRRQIYGVAITAFQKTKDIKAHPWDKNVSETMIEEDRTRLIDELGLPVDLVNEAVKFGKQLASEL